jgi:2-isopropylmalate synthase
VMDIDGKELTGADIYELFTREYGLHSVAVPLHQVLAKSGGPDGSVTITAEVLVAGRSIRIDGTGTGPIDAFVDGLSRANGEPLRVLDYHEHAMGSGANAQAVAYLELRVGQQTVFGVGIDANIVSASLKAIVSGVQRARPITTKQEPSWQKN